MLTAAAVGAGLAIVGRDHAVDHPQPARRPVPAGAVVGRVARRRVGAAARGRRSRCRSPRSPARCSPLLGTLALARAGGSATPRPAPCSPASRSRRSRARSPASSSSGPPRATRTATCSNWLLGSLAGARWPAVAISGIALHRRRHPAAAHRPAARRLRVRRHDRRRRSASRCRTAAGCCSAATALLTGAMVSVSGRDRLHRPRRCRTPSGCSSGPGNRALLPLSALVGAHLPGVGRHPRAHRVRPARAARRHRDRAHRRARVRGAAAAATERVA